MATKPNFFERITGRVFGAEIEKQVRAVDRADSANMGQNMPSELMEWSKNTLYYFDDKLKAVRTRKMQQSTSNPSSEWTWDETTKNWQRSLAKAQRTQRKAFRFKAREARELVTGSRLAPATCDTKRIHHEEHEDHEEGKEW